MRDGLANGQGTTTFASGKKYVGKYRDGRWHGQGTITFANGNKYVGEFKDDKKHGQGTYTSADKEVIQKGIWKNGCLEDFCPRMRY